jgi:hypothetical protein
MASFVNPAAFTNAFNTQRQLGAQLRAADQDEQIRAVQLDRMREINALAKNPNATPEQFVRAGDIATGNALMRIDDSRQEQMRSAFPSVGAMAAQIRGIQDPQQKRLAWRTAIEKNAPLFDVIGVPAGQAIAQLDALDDAKLDEVLGGLSQFAPRQAPIKVNAGDSLVAPGASGQMETLYTAPVAPGSVNAPAAIQVYEYMERLGPEERARFLESMRAPQVREIGGVQTLIGPGGQLVPLSSLDAETQALIERELAKGRAGTQVDTEKTQAQNQRAYQAFTQSMQGLLSALKETSTGPMAGRLPAVTSAQQTAEGAIAVIAPILKQLFRDAGEGNFTDKDQELLLDMVPKRTDHPEARAAKLQMIDSVVRAKLGMPGAAAAPPPRGPSVPPPVGTVKNGYRYMGGDPADPRAWRKVQ